VLDPRTWAEIEELASSSAGLIPDLLDAFLCDAAERLEAIRGAMERGDGRLLRESAHRLKGSGATMGAAALAALCDELERMGAEDRVLDARARLADLEQALDRACEAMRVRSRAPCACR
jgi:HPt (histidine-containing phosphotransfer) domain-containing protein